MSTIQGTSHADTLVGEFDDIYGYGGNDRLTTYEGVLVGGYGNDTLEADGGGGSIYGGVGNDTIYLYGQGLIEGGRGDDNIEIAGGISQVYGGVGNDRILDHGFENTLAGNGGDDFLFSDGLDSTLLGGAGNDTLEVGANYSINPTLVMNGGTGRDVFVLDVTDPSKQGLYESLLLPAGTSTFGHVTIQDFNPAADTAWWHYVA